MSYPLYDGVPPHERGSSTSLAAAVSVLPYHDSQRERVYRWLSDRGAQGGTDDEIEAALDLAHQTASARRRELVQLGHIKEAGFTRLTRRGRKAKVHIRVDVAAARVKAAAQAEPVVQKALFE